jgi:Arc/MetJ family transcription regulator
LVAPAARAIRLSDDGEEFEVGLREEVLERGDGELRSATEEYTHGFSPEERSG